MPWRSRAFILKSHSPVKVRHGGRQLYRATFDSSLACVGPPCSRACRHKFNMSSTIPNSTKRFQDCFRKRKYTTFLFLDGAIFFLFWNQLCIYLLPGQRNKKALRNFMALTCLHTFVFSLACTSDMGWQVKANLIYIAFSNFIHSCSPLVRECLNSKIPPGYCF